MANLDSLAEEFGKMFDFINLRAGSGRLTQLTIRGELPHTLKTLFVKGVTVQTLVRGKEAFNFFASPATEEIVSYLRKTAAGCQTGGNCSRKGISDMDTPESGDLGLTKQFKEMLVDLGCDNPGRFSVEVLSIEREEKQASSFIKNICNNSNHIFVTLSCRSAVSGRIIAVETLGMSGLNQRLEEERICLLLGRLIDRLKESNQRHRAPAGSFPAVLDAKTSAMLVHETLGHALEADFLTPLDLRQKVGMRICHEAVTLIDDSAVEGLFGSYGVDSEGIKPKKNILIEKGILCGLLHSQHTAGAWKTQPTGNGRSALINKAPLPRMSNLKLEPGNGNIKDFIKAVDNGVFVSRPLGGCMCIPEKDFYWIECEGGAMIEDGQLGKPFGSLIISGRITRLCQDILGIGDADPGEGPGLCLKSDQILPISTSCPELYLRSIEISPLE